MAYLQPTKHHCNCCGRDYEWDCFVDDSKAFHHSEATVNMDKPQTTDCVHAEVISKIDWENFNIHQPVKVKIKCPNPDCNNEEIKDVFFEIVFKQEPQQKL